MLDAVLTSCDFVLLVNVTDNLLSTNHFAVELSLSINYYSCPIPLSEKFIQLLYKRLTLMYFMKSYHMFFGML